MFTGQFYSENTPLGIIAWRGQVVNSSPGGRPRLVGTSATFALGGYVRHNAWNEYLIMARGGTFIHIMNGQLMALYVDDDSTSSNNQSGLMGIEMEQVPSKVSVRNIFLKKLPSFCFCNRGNLLPRFHRRELEVEASNGCDRNG